jgi:hypothetical protein
MRTWAPDCASHLRAFRVSGGSFLAADGPLEFENGDPVRFTQLAQVRGYSGFHVAFFVVILEARDRDREDIRLRVRQRPPFHYLFVDGRE